MVKAAVTLAGVLVLGACSPAVAEIIVFDDANGAGWSRPWWTTTQTSNVHSGTTATQTSNGQITFTHSGLNVGSDSLLELYLNNSVDGQAAQDLFVHITYFDASKGADETGIPFDARNIPREYDIDGTTVVAPITSDSSSATWQRMQLDLTQTNYTGWPYVAHEFDPAADLLKGITLRGGSSANLIVDDVRLVPTLQPEQFTWASANIADDKTIALFHFDEGQGTTAANEVNPGGSITLQSARMWKANPGWMASPAGHYLDNLATDDGQGNITTHHPDYMGRTASQLPIDWNNADGVTISFWMNDPVAVQGENKAVYLGYGGWRDQQGWFGYRPGWNNGRAMINTTEAPARPWYDSGHIHGVNDAQGNDSFICQLHDGEWHHVALVWDAATDLARMYIDDQLVEIDEDANGNSITTWDASGGWGRVVDEFWSIGVGQNAGFGGAIDELLIQAQALTDFSNGLNAPGPDLIPEPATLALLGLGCLAFLPRRRRP